MGLILDTSVLISAERRKLRLNDYFQSLPDESFHISAITLSELWHGCHRGRGPALQQRLRFVHEIEATLPILGFSRNEALIHARIWAELENRGQKIGGHDLIIAATALAHGYAIATLNESEFKRIPKLKLISVQPFLIK
jgi:tRNA(fMet)-specific endonuclease VapC